MSHRIEYFLWFLTAARNSLFWFIYKAFILPSYYEGFGIPPLEALSCGAKIIVSNAACLPEIYGNFAYYIDPNNTNIDLKELLKKNVECPDFLLKKYTYSNAANVFYELLKKI